MSDWLELIAIVTGVIGIRFAYKQLSAADSDQQENIRKLTDLLEKQDEQITILRTLSEESKFQSKRLFEIQQIYQDFSSKIISTLSHTESLQKERIEMEKRKHKIEIKPQFGIPKQGLRGGTVDNGWELYFTNYGARAKVKEVNPLPAQGNHSTIDVQNVVVDVEANNSLKVKGRGIVTEHMNNGSTPTAFEIVFDDQDGNTYRQVYIAPSGVVFANQTVSEPIEI